MKISDLLVKITPLYNNYKSNKKIISATDSICIMWELGSFINNYISSEKVAPHNLFREIYGKSESSNNIVQKSYITREFLSRSYRIFKMFESKTEIKNTFPGLKDFSSFREAMPFFDNPTYQLSNKEKIELLLLLNSKKKNSDILKELDKKKKSLNNIVNPRDQKLSELESKVSIFKEFYNYLYRKIRDLEYEVVLSEMNLDKKSIENITILTKNLSSLAQEGIVKYTMNNFVFEDKLLDKFYNVIEELIEPTDEKIRRRFRRLIPPERIIKISEYLFSLSTLDTFKHNQNKIK